MKSTDWEEIREIGRLILTQDNRITSDPIFMVQERKRTFGIADAYTDNFAWIDQDSGDYREATPAEGKRLQEKQDEGKPTVMRGLKYERVGYADEWVHVQPFFTEKAADDYVASQKHRHSVPLRVYVESGHRNPQWRLLRRIFMDTAMAVDANDLNRDEYPAAREI